LKSTILKTKGGITPLFVKKVLSATIRVFTKTTKSKSVIMFPLLETFELTIGWYEGLNIKEKKFLSIPNMPTPFNLSI
jgi:hypothetical protein